MLTISALTPASLVSAGRNAITMAKHELSTANISAALATAAETCKECTMDSFFQAAFHAFQACQANPGTAIAVGVTGVGILFAAAPGAVAAPALAAAGFGTNGIVAGAFSLSKPL
jgi:hypothetical protein